MAVPGTAGLPVSGAGALSAALLGRSLESMTASAVVVDGDGRILAANTAALRLLRHDAAALVGQDSHDLLHRDEHGHALPRSRCLMRKALLTQGTVHGDAEWFARGDGTLIRLSWLVTPAHRAPPPPAPWHCCTSSPRRPRPGRGRVRGAAHRTGPPVAARGDDHPAHVHPGRGRGAAPAGGPDGAAAGRLGGGRPPHRARRGAACPGGGAQGRHPDRAERPPGPMPPVPAESPMPLSRALRGAASTLAGPATYQGPPDSGIAVEQQRLFAVTGMHSAAIAPIRGLRDMLGALTLGRSQRRDAFTPADLPLLEDLTRRAGLALDNARLYQRQLKVAETMQRHLLPQLPVLPGLEMTSRYVPAPHASSVGGDWYDAFALAGHGHALVIGDVVGHDLDAAAGMAQVRNMLRAFAWSDPGRRPAPWSPASTRR
ncbi:SpoIIE family protein phosphatase [Streptomyces zhihengii]